MVKAVYLHVLTTNSPAISFYEHRGFHLHSFLPFYYAIKGRRKDGYTAVCCSLSHSNIATGDTSQAHFTTFLFTSIVILYIVLQVQIRPLVRMMIILKCFNF